MTWGLRKGAPGLARVATLIALVAIMMRALVAPGYMAAPAPVRDGIVTVTLCTSHGAIDALIDTSTGQIVEKKDAPAGKHPSADGPCAFAMAAHVAAPVEGVLAVQPLRAVHAAERAPETVSPGRGLAAPPPWATGPPQTA